MNIPGFTAETSIYQTSGHYQTGRHAINLPTQMISPIYPMMINTGGGVHCGNCVGGECAELHCFENWTHGGGGPGGPYEGGGDGGWGGLGGGGWGGQECGSGFDCAVACSDNVFGPCQNQCILDSGGFGTDAFWACNRRCNTRDRQCVEQCTCGAGPYAP